MYIYEYMVTKEIILDILNDKDNFVNIVKEFPGLYSPCVTIKQNVSKENVDVAMNKILVPIKFFASAIFNISIVTSVSCVVKTILKIT